MSSVSDGQAESEDSSDTMRGRWKCVLISVHLIAIVVFRLLIVSLVTLAYMTVMIRSAPWVSLASSTLQLVQLCEEALVHVAQALTCFRGYLGQCALQ